MGQKDPFPVQIEIHPVGINLHAQDADEIVPQEEIVIALAEDHADALVPEIREPLDDCRKSERSGPPGRTRNKEIPGEEQGVTPPSPTGNLYGAFFSGALQSGQEPITASYPVLAGDQSHRREDCTHD